MYKINIKPFDYTNKCAHCRCNLETEHERKQEYCDDCYTQYCDEYEAMYGDDGRTKYKRSPKKS